MHLADISQSIKGDFVGLWQTVVQDGLGLIDIFFEEIGTVYHWSIGNGKRDVFYLEGSYVVVCLGCLTDVVLVVLGTDVGKYLWTVIDLGFYLLFEEVSFWDDK